MYQKGSGYMLVAAKDPSVSGFITGVNDGVDADQIILSSKQLPNVITILT
jgi:hypothetical protein